VKVKNLSFAWKLSSNKPVLSGNRENWQFWLQAGGHTGAGGKLCKGSEEIKAQVGAHP